LPRRLEVGFLFFPTPGQACSITIVPSVSLVQKHPS
jgi:hypothetical protein